MTSDYSAFQAVTLEENYLTATLKIVAQPYSKVPGILVQKAPLQGRTDVLKLHPSSGKNVSSWFVYTSKNISEGAMYRQVHFPTLLRQRFEHGKNSALWNLFRGGGAGVELMCGRHLLNHNYKYYSDFFMGVNLF